LIPYGLCHCGCGEKTVISYRTDTGFGWKKGVPKLFIVHHHTRIKRPEPLWTNILGEKCVFIPVTKGRWTLVNGFSFSRVGEMRWCLLKTRSLEYAVSRPTQDDSILMHRFLLDPPEWSDIDHFNGIGLDNRLSNLRICEHRQNAHNGKLRITNTSGYIGVTKGKYGWQAKLRTKDKRISSGYFLDIIDAAKTYDCLAMYHWGDFARLNFPMVNPFIPEFPSNWLS
jgi:hypothetical protein